MKVERVSKKGEQFRHFQELVLWLDIPFNSTLKLRMLDYPIFLHHMTTAPRRP